MKQKRLHYILLTVVALLLLSNIYLYRQNHHYEDRNRQLILQNDSVLSVNLELQHRSTQPASTIAIKHR